MDSTKNDNESIKKRYALALDLKNGQNISGFPTYLFFSPQGEIVHKAMGFQKSEKFVQLIRDVQIPEKQLYTQIKTFLDGKMDVNLIPVFIRRLDNDGDKTIALKLARLYMKNHLELLPEKKFTTKENLWFLINYQTFLSSNDRIYELCYKKSKVMDSLSGYPGFSKGMITQMLINDYVLSAIDSSKKTKNDPSWRKIYISLVKKSDRKYAEEIIINTKHYWYCFVQDWDKACHYLIIKFQRNNLKYLSNEQISSQLNDVAWTLFEYSFDKKQLEQAVIWSNEALELDESNHSQNALRLDTKANLLYKLGMKNEAIALQEKAVSMLMGSKTTELHAALEKMKLGEPTWSIGVKEKKQVK